MTLSPLCFYKCERTIQVQYKTQTKMMDEMKLPLRYAHTSRNHF